MSAGSAFEEIVKKYTGGFHTVVPFDASKDKLLLMDFTEQNKGLLKVDLSDTQAFSHYINDQLQRADTLYGIGGYAEHRTIYSRSSVFDTSGDEGRRLHLGIDIWGRAGTPVYAPLEATVHSFGFNDAFGDYGATLILQHEIEGFIFHTLYGHLSLHSIQDVREGQDIEKGQWIATFGEPKENGHWPPHLHLQIIINMDGYKGDYPGVCAFSQKEKYLANSPDPDLILQMMPVAQEI